MPGEVLGVFEVSLAVAAIRIPMLGRRPPMFLELVGVHKRLSALTAVPPTESVQLAVPGQPPVPLVLLVLFAERAVLLGVIFETVAVKQLFRIEVDDFGAV